MPDVELARRPDVELVRTGRFQTLTGSWNPTPADIKAAVEAMDCPAIRKPVIRIGHTDKRFQVSGDGEPALGWFENLRAADGGHTLVADQVTLPWLHSVQAAAYPSRSIEGNYNHRCSEGHTHPFVIHTVALLGVTPPGVQTLRSLNDLPEMLGVAATGEVPEGARPVQVTVMAAAEVHTGAMIALIPTAEDAARLAVDGGEPAEELHVTLAYLGEAADLGVRGQQDVIDGVSTAANGLPQFEAEAFSLNCFNPPGAKRDDGKDRDSCIVLGLSGDPIDAVHDLVSEALREALWSVDVPAPHRPWHAHMTLVYTADLSKLATLVDRIGPIRFDRIRIALGGQHTDIPLIPPGEDESVAASVGIIRSRLGPIRERLTVLAAVKASTSPEAAVAPPTDTATAPESTTPAEPPALILPAAEPEPVNTDPKEDLVSTELSGLRSRLGLSDDADLDAITAKVDELKAKADTPAAPTPEMVAASAAAVEKVEKAKETEAVMKDELTRLSGELATIKASAAQTVKASFFSSLKTNGQLKPADEETWSARYDRDPEMVTEILTTRAPGSEVPVMASGTTGSPEPVGNTDEWDDIVSRLDAPKAV